MKKVEITIQITVETLVSDDTNLDALEAVIRDGPQDFLEREGFDGVNVSVEEG